MRRYIGMVFQQPNPFSMSIFNNVAFGLRLNRYRGNSAERVEQALRRAALWDEVKDKLKNSGLSLSGGQQQRLCIARAIATEPAVLLMDEPCSALDPIATRRIEELMVQLKQNYTIAIVTHNMQQAQRVADMTAFFSVDISKGSRTGYLVEYGPTKQIFESPREQLTKEYVTRPVQLSARDRDASATVAGLAALPRLVGAGGGVGLPVQDATDSRRRSAVILRGAGATFPAPLYEKWITGLSGSSTRTWPSPTTGSGSGEGQKRFLATRRGLRGQRRGAERRAAGQRQAGARLVPVTAGIIVLAYNLPGLGAGAPSSAGTSYADIFAGRIRTWNDPRIRADNPGLGLPNRKHRRRGPAGRQRDDVRVHHPSERRSARPGAIAAGRRHPRGLARPTPCGPAATRAWPAASRSARAPSATWSTTSPSDSAWPWPTSRTRPGGIVAPSEQQRPECPGRRREQMPANLRLFLPDPDGPESYPIVTLQLAPAVRPVPGPRRRQPP